MRPDYIALHHQYRAKSSGMPKADYAAAIEVYRRRTRINWTAVVITLAALAGAVYLGVMR